MRSRALRILLLGVFSLWFGVIVPGHERGAIRVPGPVASDADSCHTESHCSKCPTKAAEGTDAPKPARDPNPSSHCAICHLIGVLDVPVTFTFEVTEAELLASLPLPLIDGIAAVADLSTHRDRGPPALFI